MALKINKLERYKDQQQHTINNVVDKVNNEPSVHSMSDWFIPGVIDTSGTPSTVSLELSTAQAMVASLLSNLEEADVNCYIPRNKQAPSGKTEAEILLDLPKEVEEEIEETVVS